MVKVINSYSNRNYGSFSSKEEAMRFIRRKGLEYRDQSIGGRGRVIHVYDTTNESTY